MRINDRWQLHVSPFFDRHDVWIGCFWKSDRGWYTRRWFFYLCPLPMVGVKFVLVRIDGGVVDALRRRKEQEG